MKLQPAYHKSHSISFHRTRSWQRFAFAGAFCCFIGLNARAELPAADGGPAVPVIDVHTHVFNARDLPLAGMIHALSKDGVDKDVADLLKESILALTAPDDLDGPFPPPGKAGKSDSSRIVDRDSIPTSTAPVKTLTPSQRSRLRAYVGEQISGIQILTARMQSQSDRELVARALQKTGFP